MTKSGHSLSQNDLKDLLHLHEHLSTHFYKRISSLSKLQEDAFNLAIRREADFGSNNEVPPSLVALTTIYGALADRSATKDVDADAGHWKEWSTSHKVDEFSNLFHLFLGELSKSPANLREARHVSANQVLEPVTGQITITGHAPSIAQTKTALALTSEHRYKPADRVTIALTLIGIMVALWIFQQQSAGAPADRLALAAAITEQLKGLPLDKMLREDRRKLRRDVDVRVSPSANAKLLPGKSLHQGQVVEVLQAGKDMSLVEWRDATGEWAGWVFTRYLERFDDGAD